MIRGRLILEVEPGHVDDVVHRFSEGAVEVLVEDVEVMAEGELLRHHLRPLAVERLSVFAASHDLPDELSGALVRVHATRPDEGGLHG